MDRHVVLTPHARTGIPANSFYLIHIRAVHPCKLVLRCAHCTLYTWWFLPPLLYSVQLTLRVPFLPRYACVPATTLPA